MKKIYLMGLTSFFALAATAQTTLKVTKPLQNGKKITLTESSVKKVKASNAKGGTPNSPMAIAASMVVSTSYTAGSTQNINMVLQLTNTDSEFGDKLDITFPAGITINSTTNTPNLGPDDGVSSSDGPEAYNGITGQTISWGNDDNSYGGIVPNGFTGGPGSYPIQINISVPVGMTGNIACTYTVSGDGFGAAPADFTGTFNILDATAPLVNLQAKAVGVLTSLASVADLHNCGLTTHTVAAQINNVGNTSEANIPVNFRINGVTFTQVIIPGPIAAGDSTVVLFPTSYNFSANNIYDIKAWCAQPGDVDMVNDTTMLSISNSNALALTTNTYVNGIESAYDYGSLNLDWTGTSLPFGPSTGTKHSGAQALFFTVNMTTIGAPAGTYDAFVNLPCMDVTAGDVYKISYWKKANTAAGFTVNAQSAVFTGTAQNAMSMTTVVKAYSPITPNAAPVWTKDSTYYTATANETRYFAIAGKGVLTVNTDQINVRIDDIMIVKDGSVGVKTIAANDAISIFPNPTSGILNINAIEVNSSVEVFNVIGDKVYTSTLVKGNNVIDLSGLANGAYFVKLNSNNQITTKKVVLSK
ncbi:MAG: T9SS type A sorting domain-containing protein [Bacteroidota bacterium]